MVKVDFSQDELKLLLGLIQLANQEGKLPLGDMVAAAAIVVKIDAQIEKKPASNGETKKKEEVTTVS